MDKTEEGRATYARCEGCKRTLTLKEWVRHQAQVAGGKACPAEEIPSAYMVVEIDGRYFPMRFGRFRLTAARQRIRFNAYDVAAAYCRLEQIEYEIAYPAPSDRIR